MEKIKETEYEKQYVLKLIQKQKWKYLPKNKILELRNQDITTCIIQSMFIKQLKIINPNANMQQIEECYKRIINLKNNNLNLFSNNKKFTEFLQNGVETEISINNEKKLTIIKLIDYENIENNSFIVTNQFVYLCGKNRRVPDIILFINGIPLIVIELKRPLDEKNNLTLAKNQLENYRNDISNLFIFNAFCIATNHFQAIANTINFKKEFWRTWKKEDNNHESEIIQLAKVLLNHSNLLKILKNYIFFKRSVKLKGEDSLSQKTYGTEQVKILSTYKQFYAVEKSLTKTINCYQNNSSKIGVVWHTQGTGKSIAMLFYTHQIIKDKLLQNPTIILLTDRVELDNQLFDTFNDCKDFLNEDPIKAESKRNLNELLDTKQGGIFFTTINKFNELSSKKSRIQQRRNVIVIVDEAHRTQYNYIDGLAYKMRNTLPNAMFIAFTGTPIDKEDRSTQRLFGDYIDIYDMKQAVNDNIITEIFYQQSPIILGFKNNEEFNQSKSKLFNRNLTKREESKYSNLLIKTLGSKKRLEVVADRIVDIVNQKIFQNPCEKFMIVESSRKNAVRLYDFIVSKKPEWKEKNNIKIVMTTNESDSPNIKRHETTSNERNILAKRYKDPKDNFKIVILCNMWLTGFDAPPLSTLFLDKYLKEHNLLQAIARVNRKFQNKKGLIVDFIGIADQLKSSIEKYSKYSKTKNAYSSIKHIEKSYDEFTNYIEIICEYFYPWKILNDINNNNWKKQLTIVDKAYKIILKNKKVKAFVENYNNLIIYYRTLFPNNINESDKHIVNFFAYLYKKIQCIELSIENENNQNLNDDIELIIDNSIIVSKNESIFDIKNDPIYNITTINDKLLKYIDQHNDNEISIEILKSRLKNTIYDIKKNNIIKAKYLNDELNELINKYNNRIINTKEAFELIKEFAQKIIDDQMKSKSNNLTEEEQAFYDILTNDKNIKKAFSDKKLKLIIDEIILKINYQKQYVDWDLQESKKAELRKEIKRILKRNNWPPKKTEGDVSDIIEQAEYKANYK